NLDLYNYIIKHEISRNGALLINILDIIDELDLSSLLKAKIKGREDLGDDERYGRRVMFEFNKSYPIIMAPMLEKDQLKEVFIEFLGYYHHVTEIRKKMSQRTLSKESKENLIYSGATTSKSEEGKSVSTQKNNQETYSILQHTSVASENKAGSYITS